MKYFILSACIIATLYSCKKGNVANTTASEYFPNTTGNYWKYEITDSLLNLTSTVEVNIVGDKILPGTQSAKIWQYSYADHVDTNYVYQNGNTIIFLDNNFEICNRYVVPLQLHDTWPLLRPNYYFADSIRVTANQNFQLNDQSFQNSFLLHETGTMPNGSLDKTEWFCANIGMLTKTEKHYDRIGAAYAKFLHWQLVEFRLK
jgi:hypothetical protein